MHEHHHCECKHEHIRFCQKCQQPYCVDCGREWFDKCQQNHWYPWYSGYSEPVRTPVDNTPIVTWGDRTGNNPKSWETFTICHHTC